MLALRQRIEATKGIAQERRPLELLPGGRAPHLGLEFGAERGHVPAKDRNRPVDPGPIGVRTDRADARCAAHVQVVVQAGLLGEANAPPQLEQVAQELLDAPRFPGTGVRAEQEDTGPTSGPSDQDHAGELLPYGDHQVRVAPVVLQ